jgi:hypothetical protein
MAGCAVNPRGLLGLLRAKQCSPPWTVSHLVVRTGDGYGRGTGQRWREEEGKLEEYGVKRRIWRRSGGQRHR